LGVVFDEQQSLGEERATRHLGIRRVAEQQENLAVEEQGRNYFERRNSDSPKSYRRIS